MLALVDNPRNYDDKVLSPEEVLSIFDPCDAGWMHDGNPKSPHAELTSGKCSNGFFDCLRVLRHPNFCEILGLQLAKKIKKELKKLGIELIDWVIGSPYADITFSYEVAKFFKAIHAFTEKDPSDPKEKRMVWRRMTIPKRAAVLQIEELITTSGTFQEVRRAVREGNSEPVNFLPVVGTLIHRPHKLPVDYNGTTVVSLIERQIWAVEQKDCSLCAAGSPRYRPKTHWRELTGKA